MLVTYYQRKPSSIGHSIERVFGVIREALPGGIESRVWNCPFHSKGVVRRALNMLQAAFAQRGINHITGDVHYLAPLLAKGRTVLTIHDCVALHFARGTRRFLLTVFWFKLPVRRSKTVTVVSAFTKQELLRYVHCDPNRIIVINDPVSRQFLPCPRPFNADYPTILQVGTGRTKNILRVAQALAGSPCLLDIVGRLNEDQREALRANSVTYSESWDLSDEELIERYQRCDLVLFASTYEGFGLPIIEANATGRPVVAGNVCSMPEVAGSAACLVDPFDASSIRQGILRVINDAEYREELIARGFQNVQRFQAERVASQYASLYRGL